MNSLTSQTSLPQEVVITGRPEQLTPGLAEYLAEQGVRLQLIQPGVEDSYTWRDLLNAVTSVRSPYILYADNYTRFIPGDGLQNNLRLLEQQHADILHFKMHLGSVPNPQPLREADILLFFLGANFSRVELVNKIYSTGLCVKTCQFLRQMEFSQRGVDHFFLHLLLAAFAETYLANGVWLTRYSFIDELAKDSLVCETTEMDIWRGQMKDFSWRASVYYNALATLPQLLEKAGQPTSSVQLAILRLTAELALNLGRVCRSVTMGGNAPEELKQILLQHFNKDDLLHALWIGTSSNAGKMAAIYQTLYGDTVFNPCQAYALKKFISPLECAVNRD